MLATWTPRRSTSGGSTSTTCQSTARRLITPGEVLALLVGQELRVGEPLELPRVAGTQDARRHRQRAGARAASRLVDPDDRAEPVTLQRRLQRPALGAAAHDRARRLHTGARGQRHPPAGGTPAGARRAVDGPRRTPRSPVREAGRRRPPRGVAGSGSSGSACRELGRQRRRHATPAGPRRARRRPAGAPDVQVGAPSAATCACGSVSGTPPQRPTGSTMTRALPMTSVTPIGPCTRASAELLRLSPMTHSWPWGTCTGREVGLGAAEVRLVVDVRLVERLAVDGDPVLRVAAGHGLAAGRDDALDEVLLVRRREPDQRQPALQPPDEHVARSAGRRRSRTSPLSPQVGGPRNTTTSPGDGSEKR